MRETQFEAAVTDLLRKAKHTENFDSAFKQVERAIDLASKNGIRVSRSNLLPGIAGHYGKLDAARVAITGVLVAAVSVVVIVSALTSHAENVTAYTAPLSGLAGICLGWLFTAQVPSAFLPQRASTTASDSRAALEAEEPRNSAPSTPEAT